MSFGGGGAPPDRSVELQIEKDKEAQAQRERDKQDHDAAVKTWQGTRDASYGRAKDDATTLLQTRGLDPNTYADVVNRKLASTYSGIPELDSNPDRYFDGIAGKALDDLRDTKRSTYKSTFDKFAPIGFENDRIQDTSDDDILNSILGTQYEGARGQADALKARGAITDQGYAADLGALDRQKAGVNSRLQDLGSVQLNTGRKKLIDTANEGRSRADAYNLGDEFDPYSYDSKIQGAYGDWQSHLRDSILGAVGDNNFFDTSNFLNTAGAAQGAQNTKTVAGALLDENTKKKNPDEEDLSTVF